MQARDVRAELEQFCNSELKKHFDAVLNARLKIISEELLNEGLNFEQTQFLRGEARGVKFWTVLPEEVRKELRRELEEEKKHE